MMRSSRPQDKSEHLFDRLSWLDQIVGWKNSTHVSVARVRSRHHVANAKARYDRIKRSRAGGEAPEAKTVAAAASAAAPAYHRTIGSTFAQEIGQHLHSGRSLLWKLLLSIVPNLHHRYIYNPLCLAKPTQHACLDIKCSLECSRSTRHYTPHGPILVMQSDHNRQHEKSQGWS